MSVITSPQYLILRTCMYIFYIVLLSTVSQDSYISPNPNSKDETSVVNSYQDAIILSLGVTALVLMTELIIQSDAIERPTVLLGILLFLFVKNVFFIKYVLEKIESNYTTNHFLNIKRFHKLNTSV